MRHDIGVILLYSTPPLFWQAPILLERERYGDVYDVASEEPPVEEHNLDGAAVDPQRPRSQTEYPTHTSH